MKRLLLLFLLLSTTFCVSQVGGESVFTFLNLPSSARQMSLGGAALTIENDVDMPMWNPAMIDSTLNNQMSVNYTSYLAGISLGSVSYVSSINDKLGMFHGGVQYLDYGSFTRADEFGNIIGEFKAFDMAISFGYAYPIKNTNFTVGANIKFINSLIDTYTSSGIAADFSVLYKAKDERSMVTFVVRNAGFQLTSYDGTKEKMPFQMSLGGSTQLEHVPLKLYFTLDNLQKWDLSAANPSNEVIDIEGNISQEEISELNNASRHAVFGAELFPERKFTFRVGYNYRRAKELSMVNTRTFGGLSYGFGLKLKSLQFNYALTKFHPESNSSTFSLVVHF